MSNYLNLTGEYLGDLDRIIVPHTIEEVSLPTQLESKAVYVGPIVRTQRCGSRTPMFSSANKRILITGGGGGYPGTADFYNLSMEAVARVRRQNITVEAVLLAGPLFTEWRSLTVTTDIKIVPFDPHAVSSFKEASLVIAQGGYNTVGELAGLHKTTICVPAMRDFDDQLERALAFENRCDCFHVLKRPDLASFSELIIDCLARPETSGGDLPADGAQEAAAVLLRLLGAGV